MNIKKYPSPTAIAQRTTGDNSVTKNDDGNRSQNFRFTVAYCKWKNGSFTASSNASTGAYKLSPQTRRYLPSTSNCSMPVFLSSRGAPCGFKTTVAGLMRTKEVQLLDLLFSKIPCRIVKYTATKNVIIRCRLRCKSAEH